MSKETRRQKIRWLEHVLWVLGTWTVLGVALAVIAGASLAGAGDFMDVLRQDATKSSAAIRLVLAQPSINSQLIDNLNASIHVRALLTDLFLLDEALKITA